MNQNNDNPGSKKSNVKPVVELIQCRGKTKKGQQCKRRFNYNRTKCYFCYLHKHQNQENLAEEGEIGELSNNEQENHIPDPPSKHIIHNASIEDVLLQKKLANLQEQLLANADINHLKRHRVNVEVVP